MDESNRDGAEIDLKGTTAAERIAMMWQLTLDAWALKGEPVVDTRMQRHIVRVLRRGVCDTFEEHYPLKRPTDSPPTQQLNHLGQPIGEPLPAWKPPPRPARSAIEGRYCRLEPVDVNRHAAELFEANSLDDGRMWTYLAYGPFDDFAAYCQWMEESCLGDDPLFFAIVDRETSRAVGLASYLRIFPESGSIEVGHLQYSPLVQRRRAATEAMFLMMQSAFDLGYRRYEWKCDALNAPSRAAAERLGFSFEGVFRQATVYKGRSRDTAWYSIIDRDWPRLRQAFMKWLDPSNFDERGGQLSRLAARS
jgi:RimJ/RimL family protein N-acetyltransferase